MLTARPASLDLAPGERGEAELERLLASLGRGEPPVEEVQRAAAAAADARREALSAAERRARLAPLVPRVSAEYRHDERSYRAVGVQDGEEVDLLRTTPADVISVRASWSLDELVFSTVELRFASARAAVERQRDEAVRRATHLYFERLRLKLALALLPPGAREERARAEIDLDALTAELDAATGGLFTRPREAP